MTIYSATVPPRTRNRVVASAGRQRRTLGIVISHGIDATILPVEQALHVSDIVMVGRFDCSARHPLFKDSGPTRNHLIVFPRTSLTIRHEGSDPFVTSAECITLYNRGQHYTRRAIAPDVGDQSDYFAFSDEVLIDALHAAGARSADHDGRPFRRPLVSAASGIFDKERSLVNAITGNLSEGSEIDERALGLLGDFLRSITDLAKDDPPNKSDRDRVEMAKTLLAADLHALLSMRSVAKQTGTSVPYLCRLFRRHAGKTMTAYRTEVRLRVAYDEIAAGAEILSTAVRLCFASHSHFTYLFRRHFGVPPSMIARKRNHRIARCAQVTQIARSPR